MNGDNTPCSLNAELFEEGGSNNAVVSNESIGVQNSATNNADDHDAETTAEDGTAVSDCGTAEHGT